MRPARKHGFATYAPNHLTSRSRTADRKDGNDYLARTVRDRFGRIADEACALLHRQLYLSPSVSRSRFTAKHRPGRSCARRLGSDSLSARSASPQARMACSAWLVSSDSVLRTAVARYPQSCQNCTILRLLQRRKHDFEAERCRTARGARCRKLAGTQAAGPSLLQGRRLYSSGLQRRSIRSCGNMAKDGQRVISVVIVGGGICEGDFPLRSSPTTVAADSGMQPESLRRSVSRKRSATRSTSRSTNVPMMSVAYGETRHGPAPGECLSMRTADRAQNAHQSPRGLLGSVDVPIHLYSLYSHPNPDFTQKWASRDEVLAYWVSPTFRGSVAEIGRLLTPS